MSSINTHVVQSSAHPTTHFRFPAHTSARRKTSVSIPAELLTGCQRVVGTREAFRDELNKVCRFVELRDADSRSQLVRIDLEREVAAVRLG